MSKKKLPKANYGFNPWELPKSNIQRPEINPIQTSGNPEPITPASLYPAQEMQIGAGTANSPEYSVGTSWYANAGKQAANIGREAGKLAQDVIAAGIPLINSLIPEQQGRVKRYEPQEYNPYSMGTGSQAIYEDGGKVKKPIYVDNPKDPRIQRYNDSLFLHNSTKGEIDKLYRIKDEVGGDTDKLRKIWYDTAVEWGKKYGEKSRDAYFRLGWPETSRYATLSGNSDDLYAAEYAQPVQPFVYKAKEAAPQQMNPLNVPLQASQEQDVPKSIRTLGYTDNGPKAYRHRGFQTGLERVYDEQHPRPEPVYGFEFGGGIFKRKRKQGNIQIEEEIPNELPQVQIKPAAGLASNDELLPPQGITSVTFTDSLPEEQEQRRINYEKLYDPKGNLYAFSPIFSGYNRPDAIREMQQLPTEYNGIPVVNSPELYSELNYNFRPRTNSQQWQPYIFENGGLVEGQEMELSPEEISYYTSLGYTFE